MNGGKTCLCLCNNLKHFNIKMYENNFVYQKNTVEFMMHIYNYQNKMGCSI